MREVTYGFLQYLCRYARFIENSRNNAFSHSDAIVLSSDDVLSTPQQFLVIPSSLGNAML